ncbi:MAG: DNA-directed RNA polymerase subunit K [Nanoarchaeota archaeon]|nr:DNA-directed RNA polymerase subunit K [Nanoarchaeota archaeon]
MKRIILGEEESTKYERARIIGSRALQISMGAPFLIKLSERKLKELDFNPIRIASLEFEAGVIPIAIKRMHPSERYTRDKKIAV